MASRGLCSLGESELMTDASRLVFGEEPTEPDLEHLSSAPARSFVGSSEWASDPYAETGSASPKCDPGHEPTRDSTRDR